MTYLAVLPTRQWHTLMSFHAQLQSIPSLDVSTVNEAGHQLSTHVMLAVLVLIVLAIGLGHGGWHRIMSQPFQVHLPPENFFPHAVHVLTHRSPFFLTYRVFISMGSGGHTGSAQLVTSHHVRSQL